VYAQESQRLARISANFFGEAMALNIEAICLFTLGHHEKNISLNNQARHFLGLCGLSGGHLDCTVMNNQAEVHKLKSEYRQAQKIHRELLQNILEDQDPYNHAFALLNIAEIDVSIGTSKQNVQRNIQTARELFNSRGLGIEVTMCDTTLADLHLREGNTVAAEGLFKKGIMLSEADVQMRSFCLERLGDVSRWNSAHHGASWTTMYFVHSLKLKEKLGIHKGLQFMGDIFLASGDEDTAITLFTVALEGFTYMNVHRSRAECMLRLGDIFKGHGDLLKALELWETARPLFERSSQAKQIENIDGRLVSVGGDILGQHKKNLAHLAELNEPSGTVEELEDYLSEIKDLETDLTKAKGSH
jgi:tetratricopeptide (TPR) repeat protein